MREMKMKKVISVTEWLLAPVILLLLTATAHAATPGIAGPTFNLVASPAFITQPDGAGVYSWGYGCAAGFSPTFLPAAIPATATGCPTMQIPGPTLIVMQGDSVSVTLTNNLPLAAGNTSILFPGFNVCAATLDATTGGCTGTATGVAGLLTQE